MGPVLEFADLLADGMAQKNLDYCPVYSTHPRHPPGAGSTGYFLPFQTSIYPLQIKEATTSGVTY